MSPDFRETTLGHDFLPGMFGRSNCFSEKPKTLHGFYTSYQLFAMFLALGLFSNMPHEIQWLRRSTAPLMFVGQMSTTLSIKPLVFDEFVPFKMHSHGAPKPNQRNNNITIAPLIFPVNQNNIPIDISNPLCYPYFGWAQRTPRPSGR